MIGIDATAAKSSRSRSSCAASVATSSSDQPASALVDAATMRRCDSASTRRPSSVVAQACGAPVVGIGLAVHVARERERGDLAAGDRQVDAQLLGDLAHARGAVAVDHGEGGEPLRAELGERVARDRALDEAEAVERDDEVFGR